MNLDITEKERALLADLLLRHLPGVAVWAYGSRVRGRSRPNSDLDLVAFAAADQMVELGELREALQESDLPFLVDLHRWEELPESFHAIIRECSTVLQDGESK